MKTRISDVISGRTVEVALTDGEDLIIRCTDGQEFVIGFENGPYLKATNIRIVMPMPSTSVGAVG